MLMLEKTTQVGICSTCGNAQDCMYVRDSRNTVFECGEYEPIRGTNSGQKALVTPERLRPPIEPVVVTAPESRRSVRSGRRKMAE